MDRYPLLPVDYVFTGIASQPVTFVFAYRTTLQRELLEGGLRQAAEAFPLLQCRLVRISESDYEFRSFRDPLAIEVHESGATFEAGTDIEHFITPVRSLEDAPLTRIVLTQTPAGSVLAVSVSHALVDGYSYFHFLSSWARLCRGDRLIAPSLERAALLEQIDRDAEDVTGESFTERCGLFLSGRREAPQAFREERFFLPDASISSALQQARRSHGQSLTENDVLAAMLWQKYLPLWAGEGGNPRVYLTLPFDFRRAVPGFPKYYCGCALAFATASTDMESLLHSSTGELATLVRAAVIRLRGEQILKAMSTLEASRRSHGLASVEQVHMRHPTRGIIVTNLTRMPVADIDFGSGPPEGYSAYSEVAGGAAIMPAAGGVNILVGHHML